MHRHLARIDPDILIIEVFNPDTGESQFKLRVNGFLVGVFETRAQASLFANSPEAARLAAKAKALVQENALNAQIT
jgi:hypothetical protein